MFFFLNFISSWKWYHKIIEDSKRILKKKEKNLFFFRKCKQAKERVISWSCVVLFIIVFVDGVRDSQILLTFFFPTAFLSKCSRLLLGWTLFFCFRSFLYVINFVPFPFSHSFCNGFGLFFFSLVRNSRFVLLLCWFCSAGCCYFFFCVLRFCYWRWYRRLHPQSTIFQCILTLTARDLFFYFVLFSLQKFFFFIGYNAYRF